MSPKPPALSTDIQKLITALVREKRPASQAELQVMLERRGVAINQSSISRALQKANIRKVKGRYQLPTLLPNDSQNLDYIDIQRSGDSLVVIKTSPGSASRIGYLIDEAKLPEIAGSLAGDDTIFVACTQKSHTQKVINKIIHLLNDGAP